jgi:ankyrin repeat protein
LNALFLAVLLRGYDEIVSLLLPILNEKQATTVNSQGESALHLAAAAGEHKVCQLLLNDSRILFDVFSLDKCGASPIDKAVESGHKELANKLVMFSCVNNKATELEFVLQASRY